MSDSIAANNSMLQDYSRARGRFNGDISSPKESMDRRSSGAVNDLANTYDGEFERVDTATSIRAPEPLSEVRELPRETLRYPASVDKVSVSEQGMKALRKGLDEISGEFIPAEKPRQESSGDVPLDARSEKALNVYDVIQSLSL